MDNTSLDPSYQDFGDLPEPRQWARDPVASEFEAEEESEPAARALATIDLLYGLLAEDELLFG